MGADRNKFGEQQMEPICSTLILGVVAQDSVTVKSLEIRSLDGIGSDAYLTLRHLDPLKGNPFRI